MAGISPGDRDLVLNDIWDQSEIDEFLKDLPPSFRAEWQTKIAAARLRFSEDDRNRRFEDPTYLERLRRKRYEKKL